MEEIDGDHEAAVEEAVAAAVVTERSAAIREAEVEATAENATAAAVDEATVVATRGVVVPSAIVTKLSARVIGVARDDLPAADKECVYVKTQVIFFFFFERERERKRDVTIGNESSQRNIC